MKCQWASNAFQFRAVSTHHWINWTQLFLTALHGNLRPMLSNIRQRLAHNWINWILLPMECQWVSKIFQDCAVIGTPLDKLDHLKKSATGHSLLSNIGKSLAPHIIKWIPRPTKCQWASNVVKYRAVIGTLSDELDTSSHGVVMCFQRCPMRGSYWYRLG